MKRISLLALILCSIYAYSATYYCSPDGNADGSSLSKPSSFSAGLKKLKNAGDTLYLLGGQYNLATTTLDKLNGTSQKYIVISGYGTEKAILDFRTTAYGSRGLCLKSTCTYIHIRNLTLRYSGKNNLYNEASYCLFENLDIYGSGDTGCQMKTGGNNIIKNVDSHDNFDYQTMNGSQINYGGNADGFADKQHSGAGNTYIGCRSWNNSDDGWDFFQRTVSSGQNMIIECVCYKNGPASYNMKDYPRYETDKAWFNSVVGKTVTDRYNNTITVTLEQYPNIGNGNGFKMGGGSTKNPITFDHCLAVDNTVRGFDQNNNVGTMYVYNCSAYLNGTDYGWGNTDGTLTVRNCISYKSRSSNYFKCKTTTDHNSWNTSGISVGNNDFLSLDTTLILSQRNDDGSLPVVAFMRLKEGSKMIDAGVDVGLQFTGNAPDMGCYEYGSGEVVQPATLTLTKGSSSQTLRLGEQLATIVLTWGGSATDVEYTALPQGITAGKDADKRTLTLEGSPQEIGNYTVTVSTIGEAASKSVTITIIVKPAGSGMKVAYVTIPDDSRDNLILAALNSDIMFDVEVMSAETENDYSDYDLVVISPVPASAAAGLGKLKAVSKPTLLLKPFMLKNTVWNWGNSQNTTDIGIKVTLQQHPIFKGLEVNNGIMQMFTKTGQYAVTCINGWYDSEVTELAVPLTAEGQTIVEARAGTSMNGTSIGATMLMIGVSEYSTEYLTTAGTQLIDNACRYLLGIDTQTGTEDLHAGTTDDTIYNIMGMPVGKGADTLTKLPTGLYIMSGKKYLR